MRLECVCIRGAGVCAFNVQTVKYKYYIFTSNISLLAHTQARLAAAITDSIAAWQRQHAVNADAGPPPSDPSSQQIWWTSSSEKLLLS